MESMGKRNEKHNECNSDVISNDKLKTAVEKYFELKYIGIEKSKVECKDAREIRCLMKRNTSYREDGK